MRAIPLAILAMALMAPMAGAQAAVQREAIFSMAKGFDDTLLVVSGRTSIESESITASAAYFRTSGVEVQGLSKVCWTIALVGTTRLDCAEGPITLQIPAGSSFGFKSATPYSTSIDAPHAITTFVDMGKAGGFDGRLRTGPSAILSMVDGRVTVGTIPAFPAGSAGGFTTLESGSVIHVRGPTGILVHTMRFDEAPMLIEGRPQFLGTFGAAVAVLPFGDDAQATFAPAREAAARDGLSDARLGLLDEVLGNVRIIDADAKEAPRAILQKAGVILSEIVNGAFIRTKLSDDPNGLGDVGFAKFDDLTVTNDRSDLTFDGSYTLVAGDLGPNFDDKGIATGGGLPLLWWTVILFVVAAIAVGAWLWLRDGPVAATEPGPQHWVARVSSAVGAVALFLVWDWQLNKVLGSSILTTGGSGSGLGLLIAVELATMLLAALLIGVPVFLAVRYGLAAWRKPHLLSLSLTAAIFVTLGLGLLVLPALVRALLDLFA